MPQPLERDKFKLSGNQKAITRAEVRLHPKPHIIPVNSVSL